MTSNIDLLPQGAKIRYLLRPIKRSTTKAGLVDRLEELQRAFIKEVEEHRNKVLQCQVLTRERDDLLNRVATLEERNERNAKLLLTFQHPKKYESTATSQPARNHPLKPGLGFYVKQEEGAASEIPYKPDYYSQANQAYLPAPIAGIHETSHNTTTPINATTNIQFSGYLPYMLKYEIQEIAVALGLSRDGVKEELINRIKIYLERCPNLRQTKTFCGLWWDYPQIIFPMPTTAAAPSNARFVPMAQPYPQCAQQATYGSSSASFPTYATTASNSYRPQLPPIETHFASRPNPSQYQCCYSTPHGYVYHYPYVNSQSCTATLPR